MTIQISKKVFITAVIVIVGLAAIGGWSAAKKATPHPYAYAGVAGADLPTVVGESSIGGPKIPFHEEENYKEYTPEVLASALASGKATLLYFYADWCGTCRVQEPIHEAFFHRAMKDHMDLTGVRVNVDTNQSVMRQYGINYQHSYVLLDKTGKPVDKFFGDHSEEELIAKVQRVL